MCLIFFPACMSVCAPHVCLVLLKFRRGRRIHWNWSYKWLRCHVDARNRILPSARGVSALYP